MFNDVIKCTTYDLLKSKNKLGQIYFCTDNLALYRDYGSTSPNRARFSAIVLNTENERLNCKPSIGRYYYVIESNGLWLFENKWTPCTPNIAKYNAYTYYNQTISPVINVDTEITSTLSGDKIIDNNGLLGNGSVVIRDNNRMIKNIIESNNFSQQVHYKSYLDDGMVFIPNSNLPYANLNQSYGALHLTTKEDNESTNGIKGSAYYYGDFNIYGDIYLTTRTQNVSIAANYVPNDNEELKIFIELNKLLLINGESKLLKTFITINPLDDKNAKITIIQFFNENNKSVVVNDVGDYIYTSINDTTINTTFTCIRQSIIDKSKDIITCNYYLTEYDYIITFKTIGGVTTCTVPIQWSDVENIVTYNNVIYKKDKLLTSSSMQSTINDLTTQIKELQKEIEILKNKI